MLLHTAERQKRDFSCFCTLQKSQKGVFQASAHCRKAKKRFLTLLHTAERQKRDFSCFCTLKKGQKEVFRAWRKSFSERFDVSAPGESHFPSGLAFPRMVKAVSRVVWHFRAWRKSFSEWFGVSALGESHFPSGFAFPRLAKVISRKVWHFRA